MLYRCPYEDGHVYVCSKLAHPVPGHGKKSGYAPAIWAECEEGSYNSLSQLLKLPYHLYCIHNPGLHHINTLKQERSMLLL